MKSKYIFAITVAVISFFNSMSWADEKIMLCKGDEDYGSHASLGLEGSKGATIFV